ncbi:MAG: ATP-binding cassette domain-containing protein [Bacilli bacterium]|nr:ATP-binding cassette domain-containing protein [Bacilli bacterium]
MNLLEVKGMNVEIELNGIMTSVIGPTNSGKTTLLKKLCHILPNDDIFIDDVSIKEYDVTFLKNNIVVVFDDNEYNSEYVSEELYFNLHELGYRLDEINKRIEDLANYFKVTNLLDRDIHSLTMEERILIKILSYLIIKPKILAMDNLFGYLDSKHVKNILKYIKENNITLINVTTYSSHILMGENVIVMNNYKALMCTKVSSVLDGNSILPYMGIKLPFIIDLSHNLILYGLIDKLYFDDRKLVDKLWK